ncbi:hypothetical protein H7H51_07080 [Mycolicibacterium farcinogenes]|nr:hypothetical protein [Mycolicibacterium farcinogenes]
MASPETAVTPEQLYRLGEAAGYRVAVTWGPNPGTVDALFIDGTDDGDSPALTDLYCRRPGHESGARTPMTLTPTTRSAKCGSG